MRTPRTGRLRFSEFDIAIKLFAPTESREPSFHNLHAARQTRLKHQKIYPAHGVPPQEETNKAFEYKKGRFIEMTATKLNANPHRPVKNVENAAVPRAVTKERVMARASRGRSSKRQSG